MRAFVCMFAYAAFSMNFFSLPSILHCSAFCATCFAEFSLTTFWQFMRHHNKNAVAAWVAKRGKGSQRTTSHTQTRMYMKISMLMK